MPNPSPAPLAAFLRELAGNSKWLTWDAEFTSDELAAKILAHLGAAPRAPSAAAIEGLAAEWYEESYGQGWHDATKDEQRDFRARAKTQLDAAYAIDRPARPAAPSPAELTPIQELAQAAQDYLMAQMHADVSEEKIRALHARLGSLIGPHLVAYSARASGAGGTTP